jgi:hypothetical protein
VLSFLFYETKWLCWQDLWHGADACYGTEGDEEEKKSNLARRLGVGQKTTYEQVTKTSIKAS